MKNAFYVTKKSSICYQDIQVFVFLETWSMDRVSKGNFH